MRFAAIYTEKLCKEIIFVQSTERRYLRTPAWSWIQDHMTHIGLRRNMLTQHVGINEIANYMDNLVANW